MRATVLITILVVLTPVGQCMAQSIENIWDWNEYSNSYVAKGNNKTVTSVWLYNGDLVENGWGNVVVRHENTVFDTIPFLYRAGNMVFHEADYSKFPQPQDHPTPRGANVVRENMGEKITINMYFFLNPSQNDTVAKHFEGSFHSEWVVSHIENDIMHNPIFRITELRKGYYLIDLCTHGASLSYNWTSGLRYYKVGSGRKAERLRKEVNRKHQSIYGRSINRNKR